MSSPGTKPRTTLASLDKDCGRRGAPRNRRLAPRANGLGFGPDVLAQIDALRGTKATRKRGLFALLAPGTRRADTKAPPLTTARAYDVGAPVRVNGAHGSVFALSFAKGDGAWMPTGADDDGDATLAFAIEVFEETPAVPAVVVAAPTPEAIQPPIDSPRPVPTPGAPAEIPVATALSRGVDEDGMLGLGLANRPRQDWAEDADQFEREIQSILSGKTARPAQAASTPPPGAQPSAIAAEQTRPHDIFEQMGRNMSYATAFNLPAMELGQRFDQIEQEIAHEELADVRRAAPAQSLALTDDDIALNLGWTHAAAVAPVKPVGAVTPVGAVRPVGPAPKLKPNPNVPLAAPSQEAKPEQATPPPPVEAAPSQAGSPQSEPPPPTVGAPLQPDPSQQVVSPTPGAPGGNAESGAPVQTPPPAPVVAPAVVVTSPPSNGST